jgi:hypothetical protein
MMQYFVNYIFDKAKTSSRSYTTKYNCIIATELLHFFTWIIKSKRIRGCCGHDNMVVGFVFMSKMTFNYPLANEVAKGYSNATVLP